MKRLIYSLASAIVIALLAILGIHIFGSDSPRERVKVPGGTKSVVEELSYYIHGGKVFGKVYRPEEGDAITKRPLVVYFHEPLKTDFPESVIKSLVSDGLSCYATGFRGKYGDAVTIVKRLSKEDFTESDMIFLISDASCSDEILLAASKLGHKIQGLILIEPDPQGKAREIYQIYGKEFLTIDSGKKANAVALIENYLEERGALK